MRPIKMFSVTPKLPDTLSDLKVIAYNLWFSWNPEAYTLFQRMDRDLWEKVGHNPVKLLGNISQSRLNALAADEGFISHLRRAMDAFNRYMSQKTWFEKNYPDKKDLKIAYFSMEFGLHECLPIYSGGLGVLSGDHLKSSSDLGIPLVGVGLLYRLGYFRQYLTFEGWQQETYPENDFYNMPVSLIRRDDGTPLIVKIRIAGRDLYIQGWRIQVGRVPLIMLDTNIEKNTPQDRAITNQLYGGDADTRIRQEIVLGIGGIRFLKEIGFAPTVCHMNEGHSAFLALERIHQIKQSEHCTFWEAYEASATGNVFTTHTPVPAGIDVFSFDLLYHYLNEYIESLGIPFNDFLDLGKQHSNDNNFSMAVFALRMADHANGVSKLHAQTSRKMWQSIWPSVPTDEVPISSITNGIHIRSWISVDMAGLFDRYLGPRWVDDPDDQGIWARIDQIPDEELWRTHERRRERLVAFARKRLQQSLASRGFLPSEVAQAGEVLDPEALTIGFARRFAGYKRATLIFRDVERLAQIIGDKNRPIQLIFAGKAHPRDEEGKHLIRTIAKISREERFYNRIVFIEDYDMNTARYMVQGCDVWLNTPRRPLEASGTSGMKAAANGVLVVSTLDGWWCEGYSPDVGWAIGRGEEYMDPNYQDQIESNSMYELLEKEIIPLFYQRGRDGLPRGWIAKMKASMKAICPIFNTNRMVEEYLLKTYIPAEEKVRVLLLDNMARAKSLSQWKKKILSAWHGVKIVDVSPENGDNLQVGDELCIRAVVDLGGLSPEDVRIELYFGSLDPDGNIISGQAREMKLWSYDEEGRGIFRGSITCTSSGRFGYTVRIMPSHKDLSHTFETYLIKWV